MINYNSLSISLIKHANIMGICVHVNEFSCLCSPSPWDISREERWRSSETLPTTSRWHLERPQEARQTISQWHHRRTQQASDCVNPFHVHSSPWASHCLWGTHGRDHTQHHWRDGNTAGHGASWSRLRTAGSSTNNCASIHRTCVTLWDYYLPSKCECRKGLLNVLVMWSGCD